MDTFLIKTLRDKGLRERRPLSQTSASTWLWEPWPRRTYPHRTWRICGGTAPPRRQYRLTCVSSKRRMADKFAHRYHPCAWNTSRKLSRTRAPPVFPYDFDVLPVFGISKTSPPSPPNPKARIYSFSHFSLTFHKTPLAHPTALAGLFRRRIFWLTVPMGVLFFLYMKLRPASSYPSDGEHYAQPCECRLQQQAAQLLNGSRSRNDMSIAAWRASTSPLDGFRQAGPSLATAT